MDGEAFTFADVSEWQKVEEDRQWVDAKNALKAISQDDDWFRVGNYIVLWGDEVKRPEPQTFTLRAQHDPRIKVAALPVMDGKAITVKDDPRKLAGFHMGIAGRSYLIAVSTPGHDTDAVRKELDETLKAAGWICDDGLFGGGG